MRGAVACVVGMLVAARASAAPPSPTQPAPVFQRGSHAFIAFAGRPAKIRIPFTPVAGATGYRASWVDAGAPQTIELPANATVFEHAAETAGHHDLAMVAILGDGRESPATTIGVDVVTIAAIAPGFTATETPRTSAFAIGVRFSSPGLTCRLGAGPPAAEVQAVKVGRTTLRCGGEAGQPEVELPLVIAPVVVATETRVLPRQAGTLVHVTIATVATLGDKLDVRAIGELDLGPVQRTELGLDILVTPRAGATTAGLRIVAGAFELGHVDLSLGEALPPGIPDRDEPAWFALELGAQGTAFIPPLDGMASNNLGNPQSVADTTTSGGGGGLRIGFFPTRRVGLEAEAELVATGYASRPGAAGVVLSRLQLAARVVEDHRFGLRLLVGADVLAELANHGTARRGGEGGVHYGAAFTFEALPNLWLRFEALDVISPAQDAGFAHSFELQIGAVTRLGRRDHW